MKTTVNSRNLWIMVILWGGYWSFAPYVPRHILFDILNALSIAACLGVIVVFYPSVAMKVGSWRWFMFNNLSSAHYFVGALCGTMLYVIMRHTYNMLWRILVDVQDPYQNSLVVGFMIWFITTIAYAFVISLDLEEGHVPARNWRLVGVIFVAGASMAGLIISWLEPAPPLWLRALFDKLI